MLERLRNWIHRERAYRADHIAAWASAREPDETGFSPHLVACERLVSEVLREQSHAFLAHGSSE